MNVKIDTKEKFHQITVNEPILSAKMAEDATQLFQPYLSHATRNIVLELKATGEIEMPFAETLINLQQSFYENGASFVICEVQPQVEAFLDEAQLLEVMNLTPTLSEAWDIVQMEEIEREFFDSE